MSRLVAAKPVWLHFNPQSFAASQPQLALLAYPAINAQVYRSSPRLPDSDINDETASVKAKRGQRYQR
jgi:hypothetical protein